MLLKILTQKKNTQTSGADCEHKHSKIVHFSTLSERIMTTHSVTARPVFTKVGKMTYHVDEVNESIFLERPADIRIRIHPTIWIRIPDQFWLTFWHWWRLRCPSTVLFVY